MNAKQLLELLDCEEYRGLTVQQFVDMLKEVILEDEVQNRIDRDICYDMDISTVEEDY